MCRFLKQHVRRLDVFKKGLFRFKANPEPNQETLGTKEQCDDVKPIQNTFYNFIYKATLGPGFDPEPGLRFAGSLRVFQFFLTFQKHAGRRICLLPLICECVCVRPAMYWKFHPQCISTSSLV